MAIQLQTDKYGYCEREVFTSQVVPFANVLTVENDAVKNHYGMGVAITGSSCYLLSKMDKQKRTELLENIYGKNGLGLSIARISVGSSDYSAELYTYDDVDGDVALEHFSVERDEKYVIPMIKEILAVNPTLKIFASPWSPPGWMKTGGQICGGHMRAKFVGVYAEYIVKFVKAYEKHGIKIFAFTPQNECETSQEGRMAACIWNPETEAEFIKILRKKLDENGLGVKIWLHDHNFVYVDRVKWLLENDKELVKSLDGVAFHYYHGRIEQTKIIKQNYPQLGLHFTEGGPRLYDNYDTDWCKWAVMFCKSIACGYQSFTGWNLVLDERGGPNIGPFWCGGFVTAKDDGSFNFSGQYKAMKHISPYVTPSSILYPITSDKTENHMSKYPETEIPVFGVLIVNDKEKIVIVTNPHSDKKQAQIEIDGKNYYLELMPDSISTIIF